MKVGEQFGIETKFLTNEDVKELLPAMRGEWLGAMYTPSDGHAQPNKATNAIAISAREHGALFRTMEAVEGIEVTDGEVSAVITERDQNRHQERSLRGRGMVSQSGPHGRADPSI